MAPRPVLHEYDVVSLLQMLAESTQGNKVTSAGLAQAPRYVPQSFLLGNKISGRSVGENTIYAMEYYQQTQPDPSKHRRGWSHRKRTAIIIMVLIVVTPFAAAAGYVWNISRAIEEVQTQSVISLPTSQTELGGVRHQPDATPKASPQSTITTVVPNGDIAGPTVAAAPPTVTPSPTEKPSSMDITRDLLGVGTRTDVVKPGEAWPEKNSINILVLGIDTRKEGVNQNADLIMIARLDFVTDTVRVVSIPRDLYVEIPGAGLGKINSAYNSGVSKNPHDKVAGIALMRDTIEYNFGIPIDEYALIDFNGFVSIINAVGGITINVPERIEDNAYPTEDFGVTTLVIEAGNQHMDGEMALAYARTRHQDSDDQRRERQMLVIRSLLDKAQSFDSVTRITQIIQATGDTILTSIGWDKQLALLSMVLHIDQNNVSTFNITDPLVQPKTTEDGEWIYTGDPIVIGEFIEDALSGKIP